MTSQHQQAILALADGTVFYGRSLGATGSTVGEVVFNTSMTGYQEVITDPSYSKQIVTFTYPHIGNVGVNAADVESTQPWAAGVIIRDYPALHSSWRAESSLAQYLAKHGVVGISDIDTRELTRIIRNRGAQHGCITTDVEHVQLAIDKASSFAGLTGCDLAKDVSTKRMYQWTEGTWQTPKQSSERPLHVVVYDYGVKHAILRRLIDRGCKVTVVPATTAVSDVEALKPNGVLLSNGPGDPAACEYAVQQAKHWLAQKIPTLGICLGFQIMAIAAGAKTQKMAFGHHGANHPVKDISNDRVMITSQNHGFCVDETTLPEGVEVSHRSLFDNTLQGLRWKQSPALAFQGHPEAGPGPNDAVPIFDEFLEMMK